MRLFYNHFIWYDTLRYEGILVLCNMRLCLQEGVRRPACLGGRPWSHQTMINLRKGFGQAVKYVRGRTPTREKVSVTLTEPPPAPPRLRSSPPPLPLSSFPQSLSPPLPPPPNPPTPPPKPIIDCNQDTVREEEGREKL